MWPSLLLTGTAKPTSLLNNEKRHHVRRRRGEPTAPNKTQGKRPNNKHRSHDELADKRTKWRNKANCKKLSYNETKWHSRYKFTPPTRLLKTNHKNQRGTHFRTKPPPRKRTGFHKPPPYFLTNLRLPLHFKLNKGPCFNLRFSPNLWTDRKTPP